MDKDWIVLLQDDDSMKSRDPYGKLLEMLNRLDADRGCRFTDEQAETIQAMIAGLIETIRSYKHRKMQ